MRVAHPPRVRLWSEQKTRWRHLTDFTWPSDQASRWSLPSRWDSLAVTRYKIYGVVGLVGRFVSVPGLVLGLLGVESGAGVSLGLVELLGGALTFVLAPAPVL